MLIDSYKYLSDLLTYRRTNCPEKVAYRFLENGEVEKSHLTYQVLEQKARAIASHLQQYTSVGDRVILTYPPNAVLDFIVAFFGCLYGGVIAVPTYPATKGQKWHNFQFRIKDCQVKLILTVGSVQNSLQKQWQQKSDFHVF